MRRTASGNFDASILTSTTPYVHMKAESMSVDDIQLFPAEDNGFRRHCVGGTVQQGSSGINFALPPGFEVEVSNGYLTATGLGWQGSEPIFSLPIVSIIEISVQRVTGKSASLWQVLCGCCFGEKDVALQLSVDAPIGWLQMASAPGLVGPMVLNLCVRDVEEWIDAMGVRLLLVSDIQPISRSASESLR